MKFDYSESLKILARTPIVLESYLSGLSDKWLKQNEGPNTWSPYEVVGHLISGEKTDWMNRVRIILDPNSDKSFFPYDRESHLNTDQNRSIAELLAEFASLRNANLKELNSFNLTEADFLKTGIHPEFGEVKLAQLLSTWTVHDLAHLAQITRVMAKQYKEAVGPWSQYLSNLD